MQETMGELLAMGEGRLIALLGEAMAAERDLATRKQALIAALAVLRGEPARATPLADMMERIARKARQDGDQ